MEQKKEKLARYEHFLDHLSWPRAEGAAQWGDICLACINSWVHSAPGP